MLKLSPGSNGCDRWRLRVREGSDMAIAAVPGYLGQDFSEASPGMRFSMYLPLWGVDRRTGEYLWETYEVRGQNRQEREVKNENKVSALKSTTVLNANDKRIMQSLLVRQQQVFASSGDADSAMVFAALAVAPFTTGLGNEHPLENGFAFLNPYGLPYLPGSGVKGVLRQAARELASGEWDDASGWNEAAITALFGLQSDDGDSHHQRGALIFWDVIPQLKGDSLSVEIMTPHQKHYYQEGQNPHDSGQPVPISFLTVPPGSGFTFHVQCNRQLLETTAPELVADNRWQALLQAAFEHAFNWLGFGAKTAVGYGAMVDQKQIAREREQQQQADLQEAGIVVGSFIWKGAQVVSFNAGAGEVQVRNSDGKLAVGKCYSQLSDADKKRLKNKKPVHLDVEIEEKGNLIIITALHEPG